MIDYEKAIHALIDPLVEDPDAAPTMTNKGELKDGEVSRIQVCYVYTNVFGSTLISPVATKFVAENENTRIHLKFESFDEEDRDAE